MTAPRRRPRARRPSTRTKPVTQTPKEPSVLDGGPLPLTLVQLFENDLPDIDPTADMPIYEALARKLSFAGPADHHTEPRSHVEI